MNLARNQTLAEWTLAVHCERWSLLRGMYAEARKARRGQRRCWEALRQHASMMLEKGI